MRIGLACYEFRNGDTEYNLGQIEKGLTEAAGKADLLCFGETFLQGFDALCWDYEKDRSVGVNRDSETFAQLKKLTVKTGVDLLTGYIEAEGDALYSSCVLISGGRTVYNYRRISVGWKEFSRTDAHYREGGVTEDFDYRGRKLRITLCGDLWEYPERFRTDGVLIWPVYVDFSLEDWKREEKEYAVQAAKAADTVLMVNSITRTPVCHGGAFRFEKGEIKEKLPFDREGILYTDL